MANSTASPVGGVKLSIGTKLLISIVALLLLVIAFLNISAIFLLRDDKRAYTYQAQSTSATLTGEVFLRTSQHVLDTLKISLGSTDPTKAQRQDAASSLQPVVDNQSDIASIAIFSLNSQTGNAQLLTRANKKAMMEANQLNGSELSLQDEWMKTILPELQKNSYAFTNLSHVGGVPVLGVLAVDMTHPISENNYLLALGVVPLKGFGKDLTTDLTVATRSGWVLFSTDTQELYGRKNISNDPLYAAAANSRVASGASEFEINGVKFLGSFNQPGLDLLVLTRTEWTKAMFATYALTEKFVLLGLMSIGVAVIFAILFSKSLTAPINRLFKATAEVSQGNFNLELQAQSHDEIGALTDSFNVMSRKISDLIQESMKKVQLENELAIASTVQQTLIPPPVLHKDRYKIHSHYQSASSCGGDLWCYFEAHGKLILMIADATGHGIASALITASARSCFSVLEQLALDDPEFSFSSAAMLDCADRVIYDASHGQVMMTCFVAVFDFNKGTFNYASASHNPPWFFRKEAEGYKFVSLVAQGRRLGDGLEPAHFEEKTLEFKPEDVLFLYTDGLIEGTDLSGAQYGKKRARNLVSGVVPDGPAKVIESIVQDFMTYNEGKSLDDDITLATAKF